MDNPTPLMDDGPPAGFTWGIKQSFLRYIGAIDDASINLHGGASMLEAGAFNFEYATSNLDADTKQRTFDFGGTVQISAHSGMLALTLHNPRVAVAENHAILSIEKTFDTSSSRIPLCTMTGGGYESLGSDLLWSSEHVFLTPEGASVFGGQYPAGQRLDPMCWRIAL